LEEEKIIETGDEFRAQSGSGRSRKLLTLNDQLGYFIGVEINAKGIFLSLTNVLGHEMESSCLYTADFDVRDINAIIIDMLLKALNQHQQETCLGIGIAIPGHFEQQTGKIISNNPRWADFNLKNINKNIPYPISIDNNIEGMALGEYLFQADNSPEKFLFIHIGPGLYCSFFDNEHIAKRDNFYIGEIGHTVVDINGTPCECGKHGCLQTYISETWLISSAQFLFNHAQNTILKTLVSSPEDITLDVLYNAYLLRDPFIAEKIESGIQFLATSIANTLIIYDSYKVYINSQLLNYPTLKEKLIQQITAQLQFIPNKTDLDIEVLPVDSYRGAKGACALAAFSNFIQ
uniref:ROK family protein n=1 Tax=Streptococcus merionis TaxID=400065 RepID=UPI0026EDDB2B